MSEIRNKLEQFYRIRVALSIFFTLILLNNAAWCIWYPLVFPNLSSITVLSASGSIGWVLCFLLWIPQRVESLSNLKKEIERID